MAQQMYMPQRRDPLARIGQILGIVNSVYGIKTDYERGKLMDLQRQQEESKALKEKRLESNIFTPNEATTLYKVDQQTTDPSAVTAYEIDDEKNFQPGMDLSKAKQFKYVPLSSLKNRSDIEKLVDESDEKKGIYTPDKVLEMGYVLSDRNNKYATPIRLKTKNADGSVSTKDVYIAKKDEKIDKEKDNSWQQSQALERNYGTFKSAFKKEVDPIVKTLEQLNQNQRILDGVKRGEIEPGQAEGLVATIAATSAQPGVLTDRDFERGSFSPTSIKGMSEQQLATWLGNPTDRLKKLEWLNKANLNALNRKFKAIQNKQKKEIQDYNKRNAKFNMQIDYENVAPYSPEGSDLKSASEKAADNFLGE